MDQNVVVGCGMEILAPPSGPCASTVFKFNLSALRLRWSLLLLLFSPLTLQLSLIMSDYGGEDDAGIK